MQKLILFFLPVLLASIVSCSTVSTTKDLDEIRLTSISGQTISAAELINGKVTCIMVLSPECPLCQNYAVKFRKLISDYPELDFVALFPGTDYSASDIKAFMLRYDINCDAYLDPDLELVTYLSAEVTPEVFLFDNLSELKYSGAIDNWAVSLGRKRTKITEHYLNDAIKAMMAGEAVKNKKTKAVGCLIESI